MASPSYMRMFTIDMPISQDISDTNHEIALAALAATAALREMPEVIRLVSIIDAETTELYDMNYAEQNLLQTIRGKYYDALRTQYPNKYNSSSSKHQVINAIIDGENPEAELKVEGITDLLIKQVVILKKMRSTRLAQTNAMLKISSYMVVFDQHSKTYYTACGY